MIELKQQIDKLQADVNILKTLERPVTPVPPITFAARANTATAQPFASGALTIVQYNTITYGASLITTGASWAYTCLVGGDGLYVAVAMNRMAASTTWTRGEDEGLFLYKNGAQYSALNADDEMDSAGILGIIAAIAQMKTVGGSDHVMLAAGDTLDFRILQLSGAPINLNANSAYNHVAIAKIG